METKECAQKPPAVIDRLEALGFKRASTKLKDLAVKKRKMALAYELYRFVRPENINRFNDKLRADSYKSGAYKILDFVGIESYKGAPPESVLASLETAQGHNCFDKFEVAYIRDVADPIIFGRIDGCEDRFYIDQWDEDVKIEDILRPNEG
jgi:hypothetical protein